jgi:hypothetical protein
MTDVAAGSSDSSGGLLSEIAALNATASPAAQAASAAMPVGQGGALSTIQTAGTVISTVFSANGVLIIVGIVLALGALLISQKQPIQNIVGAAAGAARSGAAALA